MIGFPLLFFGFPTVMAAFALEDFRNDPGNMRSAHPIIATLDLRQISEEKDAAKGEEKCL